MKKKYITALLFVLFVSILSLTASTIRLDYSNPSSYTVGDGTIRDKVDSISINWINGDVKVVTTNKDTISIEEKAVMGKLTDDLKLRWKVEGRELKIQYAKGNVRLNDNGLEKDLIVYVPRSLSIDDLEFDGVSASFSVELEDLYSIEAESVSGDVTINARDVNKIDTESVSGNISVTVDDLYSFDSKNVSGNVSLTVKSGYPNKLEVETVSGNTYVTTSKDSSFRLESETISGELAIDFSTTSTKRGSKMTYIAKDGRGEWEFESVSGNLKISKY